MTRYHILSLISLCAICPMSQAQTEVLFNAGPGQRNVVQSDGTTPVPDGNYVEVGYFDTNPNTISTDLLTLGSHWHEYGFTTTTTFGVGPETPVGGRFTGDTLLTDPTFNSKQIYLWIFDTTGNGAPAPDFSNVTQYGIFSSSLGNWFFPVDGSTPPANQTTITSSEVNQFIFGGSVAGSPGSLELANVVGVPEPGAMSLLAVGLVMHQALRRKKQ